MSKKVEDMLKDNKISEMLCASKLNDLLKKEEEEINEKQKFILLKFILTGIVMVVLSVLLTYQADKIAHMYPKFSSSSIGAILLGITTIKSSLYLLYNPFNKVT